MTTDLGYRTNIRIGASIATMADVKIEPVVEYQAGDIERVVTGQTKAVGSPRLMWRYPDRRLTGAQYRQLKNLVGDSMSASVYVDVPTNNVDAVNYKPIVATYQGILQWPIEGVERVQYDEWAMPDLVITNVVAV